MRTREKLRSDGIVAIVGAGPGGTTLAQLLHRCGFSVRVLERDQSLDARPQGGSLDLRQGSGQRAIAAAGLAGRFAELSREDAKAFRMIGADGQEMPGAGQETHEDAGPEIDRGDLRGMLVGALPDGMIAWDQRVEDVSRRDDGRWQPEIAGRVPVVADLVVGADGIGSRVRAALTDVQPVPTGITMVAAHVRPGLWRRSKLSDLLGEGSLMVMAAVRSAYRDWSAEVVDMPVQVQDRFQLWPTSVMPPFTGKGVNLALRDALELAEALSGDPTRPVQAALAGFEQEMQAPMSGEIRACLKVGQQAYGIALGFDLEEAA